MAYSALAVEALMFLAAVGRRPIEQGCHLKQITPERCSTSPENDPMNKVTLDLCKIPVALHQHQVGEAGHAVQRVVHVASAPRAQCCQLPYLRQELLLGHRSGR